MADKQKIADSMLDDVTGGKLTFSWDGETGRCGMDGNDRFVYTDKEAFEALLRKCIQNNGLSDVETLRELFVSGIVRLSS